LRPERRLRCPWPGRTESARHLTTEPAGAFRPLTAEGAWLLPAGALCLLAGETPWLLVGVAPGPLVGEGTWLLPAGGPWLLCGEAARLLTAEAACLLTAEGAWLLPAGGPRLLPAEAGRLLRCEAPWRWSADATRPCGVVVAGGAVRGESVAARRGGGPLIAASRITFGRRAIGAVTAVRGVTAGVAAGGVTV
jgi:hypothetical protein